MKYLAIYFRQDNVNQKYKTHSVKFYFTEMLRFLIVSKMVFSAQGGVLRPSARLSFRVGHHVCLGHPGDAKVVPFALI